jgi:hypothetical protein
MDLRLIFRNQQLIVLALMMMIHLLQLLHSLLDF